MRFAEFLNDSFLGYLEGYNKTVEIFVDPSQKEMREAAGNIPSWVMLDASSFVFNSGSVGIGNPSHASAKLSIWSTTQGFLSSVMTTTQRLAISAPTEGLQVYDVTLHTICFYNGTNWQKVTSSNAD